MRWTLVLRQTNACLKRTAKSCGPDIPTLISSRPRCCRIVACDGGKKARLTEEITKEAVKPSRRECRCAGNTCSDGSSYAFFVRIRGCGCGQNTRHSLRPLISEGRIVHDSGVDYVAGR